MAQKMSKKKKVSAAITAVLAVAVAVGGAYAWTDYTQNARNTFNVEAQAEVLLHDDFDGENKDVYVENTGSTEVYVRVKFVEYFQIGTESMLPEFTEDGSRPTTKADPDDVKTWPTHRFDGTNEANREVCDLVSHHDYFTWVMSGEKKAYLSNIKDFTTLDGSVQSQFETMNVGDTIQIDDITATKKETAAKSDMMLLSAWLKLTDKPEEPCWLLDTDGWAYWSAPLAGGEATNLLLDEVITSKSGFYDNSVYHIDVQLQAATLDDLAKWEADGTHNVANPDNDVATVTANGHNYILYMTGGSITYRYEILSNNVYQEVAIDSITGSVTPTGNYQLAGNDQNLNTTDDNNMLAGRSKANNGGIEIANINVTDWSYAIKGISGDYYVTAGIDGLLGTYDDVIKSKSTALGRYPITTNAAESVGWNYLGGPLDNMLVATEYVLDNVTFNDTQDTNGYKYENSNVFTTMQSLWTSFGMDTNIVKEVTNLDMDHTTFNGKEVWTCLTGHTTHSDSKCKTPNFGSYSSTVETQSNINLSTLSTPTRFFALSLDEIYDAYGEPSGGQTTTAPYNDVQRFRTARYASNYTGNYQDDTWSDGVTRTHYWLRSPGYYGSRAAFVFSYGVLNAYNTVTRTYVGVRPACYLNLSSN